MNILFIMYDQLRFDYLSCAGHPHLHTPNFDRVAEMGVRFTNAYVQSPICGSSRMSYYTGRYPSSHGAQWNNFPLRVGELTLGDHLRKLDMECWLIGKTHMHADVDGMKRLGLDEDSVIGARQAECGFDIFIRDDGLWAQGIAGYYDESRSPYNEYLKAKGYSESDNPWADHANAGVKEGDQIASGWMYENADRPAHIHEPDSETAWLTSRTIDFLKQATGRWCAHVSYIKPHWPYIVAAPYHDMFGPEHVPDPRRHELELEDTHPVFNAYMTNRVGQAFQRDEVRQKVIPAYMGLIKQCDDHLGRILDHLEGTGAIKETMIVLTSDHGDYLGDHWMGEKSLFHDQSAKVPMIIYDPRQDADATRGTTCDALVESLDIAATFVEAAGGAVPRHILEGHSLLPWLKGERPKWREFLISEFDYSASTVGGTLADEYCLEPRDCRLFMVFDGRWKMMHAEGGFRPMLFDLENDPDEFIDLGKSDEHAEVLKRLYSYLAQWGRRMSQRVTKSDEDIENMRGKAGLKGVLPFMYDGSEVPAPLIKHYVGKAPKLPDI
ncbi:MAG: sulfatase-like hydrolase/transferase [Pseudomonadota bacterium]